MNKNFLCVLLCIVLHGTQTIKTVLGSDHDSCRWVFGCSYDEVDCPCRNYRLDYADGAYSEPQYPKSTEGAERIYRKKILEIEVVVSPGFYEVVKKQLGQNIGEEMIEKRIKKNVQELFTKAQRYLLDDSISKTGGFTLVLNGIEILKNYQQLDLEGLTDDGDILKLKFSKYAMALNPSWSADLMVLLNGDDFGYMESATGVANTGSVCTRNALAVVTVSLTNGKPSRLGPKILAHEIGHILGATHDGHGRAAPCQPTDYIMAEYVTHGTTWSTCSQRDIDQGERLREHERKNCFYTNWHRINPEEQW